MDIKLLNRRGMSIRCISGTTGLSRQAVRRTRQPGARIYFTTLDDMIRKLSAADSGGKLASKLRTFTTKSQLLVIDEVGYLSLTRVQANYLFQVVANRYEKSSLILTSNKAVTEWPEVFSDHALATAILDRLLHHSHVISTKGNSYGLKEKILSSTHLSQPKLQPYSGGEPKI